jgi:hypothetical protein
MTNWKKYEDLEEELNEVDSKYFKIKKKKTWKELQKEKERQMNKKKWQKKRRNSKTGDEI